MNNWGWQIQNKFIDKKIKDLFDKKYKKFNSLIEKIFLNNKEVKININYELKKGDQIFVLNKNFNFNEFLKSNISKIIHETKDFLIVYKGYGITTHPDSFHKSGTLLNLINDKLDFKNKEEILEKKLGIVHRLDKPTTGILIVAKNFIFFSLFKKMMLEKKIKKIYLTIVDGVPENNNFIINAPLTKPSKNKKAKVSFLGSSSLTYVKLIKKLNNNNALLEINLKTGRTHQIRSHLKFVNLPIKNDKLYNFDGFGYIFLHAYKIKFILPNEDFEFIFSFPKPSYFNKFI